MKISTMSLILSSTSRTPTCERRFVETGRLYTSCTRHLLFRLTFMDRLSNIDMKVTWWS